MEQIIPMKISVVIPLYNKEKHIARAIDSVLAQEFKNFELIVIDDGSTDNSALVAKKYEDNRLRLICQENRGEGAARNAGIALSSCDYVAFLDADDAWHEGFLTEIVSLIRLAPECVIFATFFKTKEPNGDLLEYGKGAIGDRINLNGHLSYIGCLSDSTYPFLPSSSCVKRACFDIVGGFDSGLKIGADIDMWVRLCAIGDIAYSPIACVTYYRDAENRSVHQSNWAGKCYQFLRKMRENLGTLSLSSEDRVYLTRYISRLAHMTAIDFVLAKQGRHAYQLQNEMQQFLSPLTRAKIVFRSLFHYH